MLETKQPLIEQIFENPDKVYDEKMKPLVIQTIRDNFRDVIREGQKMLVKLEKDKYDQLLNIDLEDTDINSIADVEMDRRDLNEKIKVVQDLYVELFGEEM